MRSIFVLLSACSTVAQATECQVAEETTMLQTRRSVQKRMTATDTQGLNARGLVKSLEHVANNFASMTTDDVNQALADAAAALATLSPAIQAQVGFLQDTINHASEAVEACHGDPGVVQRAALWEAAEAQAVLSATCEAELATAVADEAQICSAASVADVQSECACNEATVRREDKDELCAAILAAYEFAYCEHNLLCNSYHDCHETETAVYNQVRGDVEAEMVPVEAEYVAAEQSTCIMGVIQANMLAGEAMDFVAIAACSAVDTSSLLLVYPELSAAPEACPGATTGSPPCAAAAWELIVHQTVPNWFPGSARTTFNVNEGDSSASSFMNVGTLTPSDYLIDGKYHLRLVYGVVTEQHSAGNDGSALNGGSQEFEWTQTSWITSTAVTGYEPITADLADSPDSGCVFHGLAASSTSATVLDGSPDNGWWFQSVGSTTQWGAGIPAFKGGAAQTMSLYISR